MQLNRPNQRMLKSRIQVSRLGRHPHAGHRRDGDDGICRVHGLSDVMQGEMLEFRATPSAWR